MKIKGFLALTTIVAYLFLYLPICILILFSFNDSHFSAHWEGFTLKWYMVLFQDEALLESLVNSLWVAGASSVLSTVIALGAALSFERYQVRYSFFWEGVLYLPFIVPELMMAVALLLFFVYFQFPLGFLSLIASHTCFNVPVVWLILRARLKKLNPALEEAAADLGATPWKIFQRVMFPQMVPGILGGLLLAFTLSLDDFIISFFVAGTGSTTLPVRVYSMIKQSVTPEINALSTLLILFSFAILLVLTLLQNVNWDEIVGAGR